MKIGYIRVSRASQQKNLQVAALKKAGCKRIFSDVISGKEFNREGLNDALTLVQEGDTLVVWKLDRLGRSLRDLIDTLDQIQKKGAHFISLTEMIDTTSPMGVFIFQLIGALAQLERELIRERVKAGIAATKALGKPFGPQKPAPDDPRVKKARLLLTSRLSITSIAKQVGISRATLYRWMSYPELGL